MPELKLIAGGRSYDERAFLPAALEVLETPPNPLGRRMALTIGAVAVAAIAWSTFGKVDIVAVATGKLVSHLHTQVVQPFEPAVVKAVHVRAGDTVKAGDVLIEFDRTAAVAERNHAERDRASASLDRMRLIAFLADQTTAAFDEIPAVMPSEIARAEAELDAQVADRDSRLATLTEERRQHVAERDQLTLTAAKLDETLPLIAQRSDIRTKAGNLGNSSLPAMLEAQQALVEAKAEIKITRAKIAALDATIDSLDRKIAATAAEIRLTAMGDLQKALDREHVADEAFAKAARRVEQASLRAPIDGTVQQMHVSAPGAVVTPAQQLLTIVPLDDGLQVEALVDNHDVGFVAAGQKVELKIDAYPFTRYGLLSGRVLSVDRDAEAAPPGSPPGQGSLRAADEADKIEASGRLHYTVRIALEPGSLMVDGKPAHLMPGMSVSAEILTGKRRIIDFVLAPLSEHLHDAFRER